MALVTPASNWHTYSRMIFPFALLDVIWPFIILSILFSTGNATHPGEESALQEILLRFPDLASVPLWEQHPSNFEDLGASWPNTTQPWCLQGRAGYKYHGVHCDANGHVDGLVVTDAWGMPRSGLFMSIAGLNSLKNFSDFSTGPFIAANLTKKVAEQFPLVHLDCRIWPPVITSRETIRFLKAPHTAGVTSLVNFNSLRSLELFDAGGPVTLDLSPVNSTLESLTCVNNIYLYLADFLNSNYPVIHDINCRFLLDSPTAPTLLNSTTLKSFTAHFAGSQTGLTHIFAFLNLETFSISGDRLLNYHLMTPNLKSIVIMSPTYPDNFADLTTVEKFEFVLQNSQNIPPLQFATQLTHFSASHWNIGSSEFAETLCSVVSSSPLLESIQLRRSSNPSTGHRWLPPCFKNATNLKKFEIELYNGPNAQVDPISFFQNLPLSVTEIYSHDGFNDSFDVTELTKFPNLEKVTILNFISGSMPEGFFEMLPKLSSLILESSSLTGTIPWYGWNNLEVLVLIAGFESWPGIFGPVFKLKELRIHSFALRTFPSDDMILSAGFTAIEKFNLYAPVLGGPLPFFWSQLPLIREVGLENSNFEGPLPGQISAPLLKYLNLNDNNLCGPLPTFSNPTHLHTFHISNNRFSGEIPASWEDSVTFISSLQMERNFLNGTIPSLLFGQYYSRLQSISLRENDFSGSITGFPEIAILDLFDVASTNIDVCGIIPAPAITRISYCYFNDSISCPIEFTPCHDYWSVVCSSGLQDCIPTTRSRITTAEKCLVPETRVSPPLWAPTATVPISSPIQDSSTCPPPPPPGFECVGGIWTSPGSITVPTITLPPNSGAVIVNGNFTVNGSITFSDTGTTLEVRECIQGLTEIIVEQSSNKNTKTVTLVQQKGTNCSVDLREIPVNIQNPKQGCKETKVSTSESTRSSLVAVFTVDSSKCHSKWIILGSVLGVVAVTTAVGLIFYFKFNPHTAKKNV